MTSKRGDFVRNPGAGGIFDALLFKSIQQQNYTALEFRIKNDLTNNFTPEIRLNQITVAPDYNNRLVAIDISYYDVDNQVNDNVSIYTNLDYATKKYDYENVEFIEENLRNFCLIKKSDMPSERLIFNEESQWVYGKYIFTNLQVTDPFFEDILLICNGS